MRYLIAFFLLFPTIILFHQPATAQGEPCVARALDSFARVRSEWSLEGEEVARIGRDDNVRYIVRGRNGSDNFSWYFIGIGWVRADVVELSGDCGDLPVLFTRVDAEFRSEAYPCPADFSAAGVNYLPPRLQTGQTGVTVRGTGSPYFIYTLPDRGSPVIGFIPFGDQIDSIGVGPLCNDGVVFWEANYGSLTGFVPESSYFANAYYLTTDPSAGAESAAPPADSGQQQAGPPTGNRPALTYTTDGIAARQMVYSDDGRYLAVSGGAFSTGTDVQVWDLTTGTGVTLTPTQPVASMAFALGTARLYTADIGGVLVIWDVVSGTRIETFELADSPLPIVAAFSPEGRRLAMATCDEFDDESACVRSAVVIYDPVIGDPVRSVMTPLLVEGLALAPFGNALAVTDGDDVYLWPDVVNDPTGSRNVPTFLPVPTAMKFNPGGTRLVVAGCTETQVVGDGPATCTFSTFAAWSVDSGVTELMRGGTVSGQIQSISFAADGEIFAITTATEVSTHRLEDGGSVRVYDGDSANYRAVLLAPDGGLVVAGDADGFIYFWVR